MSDITAYLAGPFFNERQRAGIKLLESELESWKFPDDCSLVKHIKLFSPSRDGYVCPPDGTEEQRQRAFEINYTKISECDFMIAWTDWALPPEQELRVVEVLDASIGDVSLKSENLNIPDSGTVWEMGYAYCQGLPIFTLSLVPTCLNLMLAKSSLCHAMSLEDLRRMLSMFVPVAKEPATESYVRTVTDMQLKYKHSGPVI